MHPKLGVLAPVAWTALLGASEIGPMVIGGTSLAGGSGTIIGGLIGACVLGILSDGLTLIGVNAFTFNIILGIAILLAMIFNIHIVRLARSGKAE